MTQRKAVSKKARFEVFKRDLFCCAYCGRKPPHTTLEVDHINPVANGGGNEQSNLITSCFDCNRGKSDRLLTSVPESLSDRAARVKECEAQLKAYRKVMDEHKSRIDRDVWLVIHALFGDGCSEIRKDWYSSIARFNESLDLYDVVDAADIASFKVGRKRDCEVFSYFCGICWNKIKGAKNG